MKNKVRSPKNNIEKNAKNSRQQHRSMTLNLGKIEEAKTHAGIVFLFLNTHNPVFQINQRINLTTDFQHQILNEDPMLMKNPEDMAPHENRIPRLTFQENTADSIEYGRNLVAFATKLKSGKHNEFISAQQHLSCKSIFRNAAHYLEVSKRKSA